MHPVLLVPGECPQILASEEQTNARLIVLLQPLVYPPLPMGIGHLLPRVILVIWNPEHHELQASPGVQQMLHPGCRSRQEPPRGARIVAVEAPTPEDAHSALRSRGVHYELPQPGIAVRRAVREAHRRPRPRPRPRPREETNLLHGLEERLAPSRVAAAPPPLEKRRLGSDPIEPSVAARRGAY